MISGGTGSGKSTLIKSILKNVNEMFTENVSRIFYVYNEPLSFFSEFEEEVEFINNIDNLDVDDLSLDKTHKLLILDDQLEYFTNNKTGSEISRLFTVKSHHTNTSVMFLSQTLFFNSQHFRLMNKNAQYVILLSNIRDRSQVKVLAQQIFADNALMFMKNVYDIELREKFKYLVLNLHPSSKDVSVHTGILPDDVEILYVYKQK
jgi:hypothetical protein